LSGIVAKTPEDELKLDMFEMQVVDYRSAYTTMCFTPPDAFVRDVDPRIPFNLHSFF